MFPKERKLLLSQTYKWDIKTEAGQLVQSNQTKLEVRIPDGHPRVRAMLVFGIAGYREVQVKQDVIGIKIPRLSPAL